MSNHELGTQEKPEPQATNQQDKTRATSSAQAPSPRAQKYIQAEKEAKRNWKLLKIAIIIVAKNIILAKTIFKVSAIRDNLATNYCQHHPIHHHHNAYPAKHH